MRGPGLRGVSRPPPTPAGRTFGEAPWQPSGALPLAPPGQLAERGTPDLERQVMSEGKPRSVYRHGSLKQEQEMWSSTLAGGFVPNVPSSRCSEGAPVGPAGTEGRCCLLWHCEGWAGQEAESCGLSMGFDPSLSTHKTRT